ncbi:MAG: hypothetical protein JEZ03_18450 [Bacteroidales bacterium]|nr:hypothetical protein [Bacteroidales bacterium]
MKPENKEKFREIYDKFDDHNNSDLFATKTETVTETETPETETVTETETPETETVTETETPETETPETETPETETVTENDVTETETVTENDVTETETVTDIETIKEQLVKTPELTARLLKDLLDNYILEDLSKNAAEAYTLLKLLKHTLRGEAVSYRSFGGRRDTVRERVLRLNKWGYVNFNSEKKALNDLDFKPLFEKFLIDIGYQDLLSEDIEKILFEKNPIVVTKTGTEFIGMLVGNVFNINTIHKNESEEENDFPPIEINSITKKSLEEILFWSYWCGLNYRELNRGNVKKIISIIEKKNKNYMLYSFGYLTQISNYKDIKSQWGFCIKGGLNAESYGVDKLQPEKYNELKQTVEFLYKHIKSSRTDFRNATLKNGAYEIIENVNTKTKIHIQPQVEKFIEVDELYKMIQHAKEITVKVIVKFKVETKLNDFQKRYPNLGN